MTQRLWHRTMSLIAAAGLATGVVLGVAGTAAGATGPSVAYRGHVQSIGWQNWVRDGQSAGTSGKSLRVESLQLKVENARVPGGIQCRAHVQSIGWQNWVGDGATCGTSGRSLRVEAVQLRLTGELAAQYDLYYRGHVQSYGWLDWASNGTSAGSAGGARRVEAIQVQVIPRGGAAPGATATPIHAGV